MHGKKDFCPLFSAAQYLNYLTDKELFNYGYQEWMNKNYIQASYLLYAYIQREPVAMNHDAEHAKGVKEAFKYCLTQIVKQTSSPGIIGKKSSGLTSIITPPTTFPLVIRGGGEIVFYYHPKSSYIDGPQVWVYLYKSQNRASSFNALKPGEAAWTDRPIATGEPGIIIVPIPREKFSIAFDKENVRYFPDEPKFMRKLMDENQSIVFSAYNNKKGFFIAYDSPE